MVSAPAPYFANSTMRPGGTPPDGLDDDSEVAYVTAWSGEGGSVRYDPVALAFFEDLRRQTAVTVWVTQAPAATVNDHFYLTHAGPALDALGLSASLMVARSGSKRGRPKSARPGWTSLQHEPTSVTTQASGAGRRREPRMEVTWLIVSSRVRPSGCVRRRRGRSMSWLWS